MPYGKRKAYTRRRSTNSGYRRGARRQTSRYAKRTRYSKYRNVGPTRALRAKWLDPLSQRQLVRFTYCDSSFSRTLNVANSYTNYYVFRGCSIFDPDYTGIGVQPYGFDHLTGTSMYSNYRVASSAIRIYFRPEEDYKSISRLHAFIIPLLDPGPVLTDISDVRMIPNHKATVYDGSTESTRGAKLKHYMSTKHLVPYSPSTSGFASGYTNNPTLNWYWIVMFYTDIYDDEEVDIYFDVKIRYYTSLTRATNVPNES